LESGRSQDFVERLDKEAAVDCERCDASYLRGTPEEAVRSRASAAITGRRPATP
jgi:hypothetical protein